MTQKEMILNQLHHMGFETTAVDEMGYMISYNEIKYLYMPDDDDEKFLRFSIPHIMDVTEENQLKVLEAINETSTFVKYTKTMILYDGVWINYEHLLVNYDNLEELLEHIIRALFATMTIFLKKIDGEDIMLSSNDEDDLELQKLLGDSSDDDDTEDTHE